MSDCVPREKAILDAFRISLLALDESGIDMVELRPREKSLKDVFFGDYDYVINYYDLESAIKVFLSSCISHGVHLEVLATAVNKRVLILRRNNKKIVVELWVNVELAGRNRRRELQLIPGASLLRALKSADSSEASFIKAVIYLTHLHYKNKNILNPLQQQRILFFREKLNFYESIKSEKSNSLKLVTEAYEKMSAGCSVDLESANSAAISYLLEKNISISRRRFVKLRKNIYSTWRLLDSIIPVVGPDGSGKTYFCKNLAAENSNQRKHFPYKKLFRNGDYKLLMMTLRFVLKDDDRNQIDERISGYVILKSSSISLFWSLYFMLRRRKLFVDRYGWDYLLRGIRRTEVQLSRIKMYGLLSRLIPRPTRIIIMTGKSDTILNRKMELRKDQICFLYSHYICNVACGNARRAFFCNTELDYEEARVDLNDFLEN